ncbi:DedA family protein [Limosilactobacillus difficilis]|uniref:DedA family protein n=1 Tax=Limosilactobacillus difficilis TaxID=2991838 RepID=UPI0024B9FFFC|nr:DedA family protein [Limosilactobacillus difficilis]
MDHIITTLIDQYGYVAICLLIAAENVFPPLPSEIILTMSGFLTTRTALSAWGVVLSATLGSLLGAVILMMIGRQLTPPRLERLLQTRLFRLLGFKASDVQRAVAWFDRHGIGAIFYGRCIPVVRSLISIPAGIARVPLARFTVLTILGSALWNTLLVGLGALAGDQWMRIVKLFNDYTAVVMIIIAILLILLVIYWWSRRIRKN